ncbi:hypothetical protein [Malikia sp.]|uniref:hypothetical protein n=1 Tax=Malikia sp. TaxID=2070706 RepID=UPI00260CBBC7|nr:hypothetical protein [Malikia sp.]MDD2727799.1 hypothetical protein [Malikia sp.]
MRLIYFSAPLSLYFSFFGFFIIGEYIFRASREDLPGGVNLWARDAIIANSIAFSLVLLWELFRVVQGGGKKLKEDTITIFRDKFSRKIRIHTLLSICLLVLIGIVSLGNPFSNPLGFRQAIQGGGAAYFLVYFIFMERVYGIYYFNQIYTRKVTATDTSIALIVIAFSLSSGFASLFAYLFIYGMIFVNARYGVRVIGFWSILLFCLLVILTPIYTLVRENLMFGGEDIAALANVFWDRFASDFLTIIYDRFDYFDLQIAGASVARENAQITNIFNALTQFVPRTLWPEKPPTYSLLMTSIFAPELLDIGVTINFGYINEFVLYFGDFGPVIAGIFFGALLCYCHNTLSGTNGSKGLLFYSVVTHGYVLAFVGGGFINDMPFAQLVMGLVFFRILGLNNAVYDGLQGEKIEQASRFRLIVYPFALTARNWLLRIIRFISNVPHQGYGITASMHMDKQTRDT